jgi:hypothetical protein
MVRRSLHWLRHIGAAAFGADTEKGLVHSRINIAEPRLGVRPRWTANGAGAHPISNA